MGRLRKPHALRPGATLGIAAPGGPIDPERLAQGEALLQQAGFRTRRREDLVARRGYLAGDDPRRAGLSGFHGPMLERGDGLDPQALELLTAQLTGEVELPQVLSGRGLSGGSAEGALVGGSLTLVTASLATPWEIETRGCILLLEDAYERPYRIDRMLQQLRAAGKLDGVVGLGFGDFSSCTDPRYGSRVEEVIEELVARLSVPCLMELPFGHVDCNAAWPVGVRATIDGDRGELRILERGVEVPT